MASDAVEALPEAAGTVFGAALPAARRYADLLVSDGVQRGLIGPRESSRIWSRHLLNSAAVAELVPEHTDVLDVGSGAGLPGIPMALARPDLSVTLLDPLQRRTDFLAEVVPALGLADRVAVLRGRAEENAIRRQIGAVSAIVARAVAPLDRLVRWCVPLLEPGGWLFALKGRSAPDELSASVAALRRAGAVSWDVVACGRSFAPTTVIRVQRGSETEGQK